MRARRAAESRFAVALTLAWDAAALAAASGVTAALLSLAGTERGRGVGAAGTAGAFALMSAVWIGFLLYRRLYDVDRIYTGFDEYERLIGAALRALVAVAALEFVTGPLLSRAAVLVFAVVALAALGAGRFALRRVIAPLRRHGFLVSRLLIVGADPVGAAIARQIHAPEWEGVEVVGFLDDYRPRGVEVTEGLRVLGDARAAERIGAELDVDGVLVVPGGVAWESLEDLLALAATNTRFQVMWAPGVDQALALRSETRQIGFVQTTPIRPARITRWHRAQKRALDLVVAPALLVAAAPLWLLLAVLRAVDGGGPLLASDQIAGRHGTTFARHTLAPARRGPRARISRTRLEGLPELWDVVRGAMSMVGPRPAARAALTPFERWCLDTADLRPGTLSMNLFQETLSAVSPAPMLRYVREYSIGMDVKIVIHAIIRLLLRRPTDIFPVVGEHHAAAPATTASASTAEPAKEPR